MNEKRKSLETERIRTRPMSNLLFKDHLSTKFVPFNALFFVVAYDVFSRECIVKTEG